MVESAAIELGVAFAAAAEWVGILASHGPGTDTVRFVPGGLTHSFDVARGEVVCGLAVAGLELFDLDFITDRWSLHCTICEAETPRRADGA